MSNYFLNDYQWEAIWLITLIMSYIDSIESETQMAADEAMRKRVVEVDNKVMELDRKLDLILEKLGG